MVEAVPFPEKPKPRFKKGDVVFLRSGQGPMNVLEIQTNGNLKCGWFSDLGEWQEPELGLPEEILCTKAELEATLAAARATRKPRRQRITREPPKKARAKK